MPDPRTTGERGYGPAHKRLRESWRPLVEAGQVDCWRCGRAIHPEDAWDLGHDKGQHRGPEHVTCNRRAARGVYRHPAEDHPNRRRRTSAHEADARRAAAGALPKKSWS